jgi:hypothetical protein
MNSLHYKARPHRNLVALKAVVTESDGATRHVPVDDLSLAGCKVTGQFRIGDVVKVKLPRIGELDAQVRWAMPGSAGLRFAESDAQ